MIVSKAEALSVAMISMEEDARRILLHCGVYLTSHLHLPHIYSQSLYCRLASDNFRRRTLKRTFPLTFYFNSLI